MCDRIFSIDTNLPACFFLFFVIAFVCTSVCGVAATIVQIDRYIISGERERMQTACKECVVVTFIVVDFEI